MPLWDKCRCGGKYAFKSKVRFWTGICPRVAFVSEWHLSQSGICPKAAFVSERHLSQSGICLRVAFVSERHLCQSGICLERQRSHAGLVTKASRTERQRTAGIPENGVWDSGRWIYSQSQLISQFKDSNFHCTTCIIYDATLSFISILFKTLLVQFWFPLQASFQRERNTARASENKCRDIWLLERFSWLGGKKPVASSVLL